MQSALLLSIYVIKEICASFSILITSYTVGRLDKHVRIKCEIGPVNIISLTIQAVSIASGLAESNIPHVNASIINKLRLNIQPKFYRRKIFF